VPRRPARPSVAQVACRARRADLCCRRLPDPHARVFTQLDMEATVNVATMTDPTLFTVIRGGEVFAPEPLGQKEILISGPRILAIGEGFADKTTALGGAGSSMPPGRRSSPASSISTCISSAAATSRDLSAGCPSCT
jgi:hypothetical protein